MSSRNNISKFVQGSHPKYFTQVKSVTGNLFNAIILILFKFTISTNIPSTKWLNFLSKLIQLKKHYKTLIKHSQNKSNKKQNKCYRSKFYITKVYQHYCYMRILNNQFKHNGSSCTYISAPPSKNAVSPFQIPCKLLYYTLEDS